MEASIHRFRVARPETQPDTSASILPVSQESKSSGPTAAKVAACSRCRIFKKKCSRTAPTCTLCERAGQKCSLSVASAAPPSWTEVQRLRERVAWLSRMVQDGLLQDGKNIDDFETGSDVLGPKHDDESASADGTPSSVGRPLGRGGYEAGFEMNGLQTEHSTAEIASQPPGLEAAFDIDSNTSAATASTDAAGRRFVDAYFRNVHRAYPFVDRNKVMQDVEFFESGSRELPSAGSRMLYLIMAVGCTSLQRVGEVPEDTTANFDVDFATIIRDCMESEGEESIQMLLLLALYSLFVPNGPATWSIVNLACSQAISSGLAHGASSTVESEQQRRLFWSIFVLDRMTATSIGLPAALPAPQVPPLPALTVDEFASEHRPHFARILQTNRQVVLLRQIEGQIMQEVHHCRIEHNRFQSSVRTDIENWYTSGCLTSPPEEDNVPVHNSVTWLSARYYYLLILLYYPCESNVRNRRTTAEELVGYVQRHLQSQLALVQQRQLPLNRVALARILPVGIVIACCVDSVDLSRVPLIDCVIELIALLESFSERWSLAYRGAQIMRDFHDQLDPAAPGTRGHRRGSLTLAALTELIKTELSRSTCFAAAKILGQA